MANYHKSSTRNVNGTITTIENIINGGRSAVAENPTVGPSKPALKQNIGQSEYWTHDEQSLLEELLIKHASDGIVKRYATIVVKLRGKTLNDVALRCRLMAKKANMKQWKDDCSSSRRHKEKIEKAACQQVKSSCYATYHSNGLHYAQSSTSKDGDECIDEVSGCATLEQNEAMNQVSTNVSAFKEKGHGKQRKDDSNSSRRHKVKSEKAAYQQVKPSSHATNHSNGLQLDNDEDTDDEISYKAFGGAAARLLEQNDQVIKQFAANISARKLHENVTLDSQARNNFDALLYECLYNVPDMKPSARQLYDFPLVSRLKKI